MDKELEEAKKWVEGRIKYIAENCDLCDTDNARAFNNFKTILQVLENSISKQAVVNKIQEINKAYENSKDENGESEYYYPDYTIEKLKELLEEK